METNNKKTNEDDGRTVADMSGVERRSVLGGIITHSGEQHNADKDAEVPTKEERLAYLKGVVAAVLLVTGIFIAAIGITILLLQLYWNGVSRL